MYESKPKWWVLYALVPLMVAGLFFVNRSGLESAAKSVADIVVIVGAFGAMGLWMRANEGAIERVEYEEAERAKKKAHLIVRGWRSTPKPSPKPDSLQQHLPSTGFGSARNNPSGVFSFEAVSANRIIIRRRGMEQPDNPERSF